LFQTKFTTTTNTTKSTAKAQAESVFIANPKKNKPEDMSGSEIIKRQEMEYDRAIQRQRDQRLQRDSANSSIQQRRQRG
jgi:hypothetical protein